MINRHFIARSLRLLLTVLVASMALIVASFAQAQGGPPRRLNLGDTVTGTLDATTFAQVYTFDGQPDTPVSIVATSNTSGLNLALLLADAQGAILNQAANLSGAEVALRDVSLPAAGTYYITVLRATGAQGNAQGEYSLSLQRASGAEPEIVTLRQELSIVLSWSSIDDFDIEVRDPVGGSVFRRNTSVPSGGRLSGNVNNGCTNTTTNPTETVSWPRGDVPAGSYEIIVYYNQACSQPPESRDFTVTVTVDGRAQQPIRGTLNFNEQYVASFILSGPDQVSIRPGGPNPLLLNLTPFASKIAAPVALGDRTRIESRVDRNNPADVWSFEGRANDVVTIAMDAVSGGSLDPQLILLGPDNSVVASNDDASNDTRNALIPNQRLPVAGRYIVVATRYGKDIGGTEGNYALTLSGATSQVASQATPGSQTALPTAIGQGTPQANIPTLIPTQVTSIGGVNVPSGSIQIALLWDNRADLRLLIRDPDRRSLFSDVRQLPTGAILVQQNNLNCQNQTTAPVTYAYWPLDRLQPGTYEIQVWQLNQCNEQVPPNYTLSVSVRGKEVIRHQDRPDVNGNFYVISFTVDANGNAAAGRGGIFTRQAITDLGDITAALANAQQLTYNRPVAGTIDGNAPFALYTFQARAGDRVRISMNNTRGTLDPFLWLLDSTGAQLAVNDDVQLGRDVNARIDQVIPADGAYVVIATRFGALFGGTSGGFQISVTPVAR